MIAACPFCAFPYDVDADGKFQCSICGCRYYVIEGQIYVSEGANRYGAGGSIADRYRIIGELYPDGGEVLYCCVDDTERKLVCLKDLRPEEGYTAGNLSRFMVIGEISVPAKVGRGKFPGLKPIALEERLPLPDAVREDGVVQISKEDVSASRPGLQMATIISKNKPAKKSEKKIFPFRNPITKKVGILIAVLLCLLCLAGIGGGVWYYFANRAYAAAEKAGMVFSEDRTVLLDCQVRSIKEAVIPEGVVKIADRAFSGSQVVLVTIPESVKEIGSRAFYNCQDLKSVVIPSGITKIPEAAFASCENLESVVLPDGLTSIGSDAFELCSNLKSVKLPASLKFIGSGAFENCNKLMEIDIPDGVEEIQAAAFKGCTSLSEVKLPAGLTVVSPKIFEAAAVEEVIIPENVAAIGEKAFTRCTNLKKIVLPNSVKAVGDSAFSSCGKLERVKIGSGVEKIGQHAFEGSAVSSVVIPGNVKFLGASAFRGCEKLKSVDIQNGVAKIDDSAFAKCTSLESIKLPESLKVISISLFNGCVNLIDVNIPAGVTELQRAAFNGCKALQKMELPPSVKVIASDVFANSGIKSVEVAKDTQVNPWVGCKIVYK